MCNHYLAIRPLILRSDAEKVHKLGGKLAVDSTLAPPPLQNPFEQGADMVHHCKSLTWCGNWPDRKQLERNTLMVILML